MGNIVIARVHTAQESAQAVKRIHIILAGVDQTDVVADVVGHIAFRLDAHDTSGLGLHTGVDELDELLGLTGTVGTHDQSNHKKSLLCHWWFPPEYSIPYRWKNSNAEKVNLFLGTFTFPASPAASAAGPHTPACPAGRTYFSYRPPRRAGQRGSRPAGSRTGRRRTQRSRSARPGSAH